MAEMADKTISIIQTQPTNPWKDEEAPPHLFSRTISNHRFCRPMTHIPEKQMEEVVYGPTGSTIRRILQIDISLRMIPHLLFNGPTHMKNSLSSHLISSQIINRPTNPKKPNLLQQGSCSKTSNCCCFLITVYHQLNTSPSVNDVPNPHPQGPTRHKFSGQISFTPALQ